MNLEHTQRVTGTYSRPSWLAVRLSRISVDTVANFAALIATLSIAVVVRVMFINDIGYNSDEAVYAGQGASIAEVPVLKDIFPVFRAHPLLFQFVLAVVFRVAAFDWLGRLVAVGVGVATVFLIYLLGNRLYGRPAGLLAALIMAIMPYHVVVTRQVLLDGPMVFATTLTLYLMVRFMQTENPAWLVSVGAGMGLSFLAKETSVILLGAIYAFLALSPQIRIRIRDIVLSLVIMVATIAPFPLSVTLAGGGGGSKTQQYLVWQLFRRPNHTWDFYPTMVPPAVGILVIIAAVAGLWFLRKQNGLGEKLLVLWILVPIAFFQLWPTKGFQYLLPTAPAIALLATRTLIYLPTAPLRVFKLRISQYVLQFVMLVAIALTLFIPTWERIQPSDSTSFMAGSGGVPGGRETGLWIRENVPQGATFMTVGPSMANIIKFYGHRQAYGLSVSPNPLHRNPSYEPINNPDFQIRTGNLQYVVWDSFSAERSTFFSEKLLGYVERYNGRAVYTHTVNVKTPTGEIVARPVIIVFEVHP